MSGTTQDELACIYASLILADDDVPVTSEKISTILKAADVQVESIWPSLFAKALGDINLRELIAKSVLCGAPSAAPGTAAATTGTAGDNKEDAKEQKQEDKDDDESDDDMGFGLFD